MVCNLTIHLAVYPNRKVQNYEEMETKDLNSNLGVPFKSPFGKPKTARESTDVFQVPTKNSKV